MIIPVKKLILAFLIMMALTGCGERPVTPSPQSLPSLTATATVLPPTSTPTLTITPTASDTPAPSATSLPTETPLPTASATPALPVGWDSTLPQPPMPISSANVTSLTELAHFGAARIYETFLSADHERLFSLTSEGIKVYQADRLERLAWFSGLQPLSDEWGNENWGFSASADGNRFAFLAAGYQVQVFDVQAGLIYTQTLPETWEPAVAISADGLYLAVPQALGDDMVDRWQVVRIPGGSVVGSGVGIRARFSPAGKYLAAESGFNVHIYRTADWQEQTQIGLSGGGGQIATDWIFSTDDRYLAVILPEAITVWEVESRQRVREVHPIAGEEAEFNNAFFSEDSSQIAVQETFGPEPSLAIWNIVDGNLVSQQTPQEAGVYAYDQYLLDGNVLHGFTVPREGDRSGYQAPLSQGYQLAFDLTAENLSIADINGWDYELKQPVFKTCVFPFLPIEQPPCQEISGPSGIASDGRGHLYSLWLEEETGVSLYGGLLRDGPVLVTFSTGGFPIQLLAVSPDQKSLVYSLGIRPSTLQVRDLVENRVLLTEDTAGWIEQARFTPDGLMLAVTVSNPQKSHPQILVFDFSQNAVLFRLPARVMQMGNSAVLSSLGDRLAYHFQRWDSYRWSGIKIIDPLHLQELAAFEGDQATLGSPAAFSPDGSLLATVDDQGGAFLLDAASGEVLHSWAAHADAVLKLTFSPDGKLLATSGADGFIRIWGVWP